jgi:hypothetical protein
MKGDRIQHALLNIKRPTIESGGSIGFINA